MHTRRQAARLLSLVVAPGRRTSGRRSRTVSRPRRYHLTRQCVVPQMPTVGTMLDGLLTKDITHVTVCVLYFIAVIGLCWFSLAACLLSRNPVLSIDTARALCWRSYLTWYLSNDYNCQLRCTLVTYMLWSRCTTATTRHLAWSSIAFRSAHIVSFSLALWSRESAARAYARACATVLYYTIL